MDVTVGRWRARLVPFEQAGAALKLRADVFRAGIGDEDAFDAAAHHLLIEDRDGLAACARLTLQDGVAITRGYTGQFYDLSALALRFPRALEIGRLCIAPSCRDAEVPRLLLAALAQIVPAHERSLLYGCSSFPASGAGMAHLRQHIAPAIWAPPPKVATVPLSPVPGPLPPLLRSYLSLGAVVSDRCVVDADLGTLHVFTGLPVKTIPRTRARRLTGLLDAV